MFETRFLQNFLKKSLAHRGKKTAIMEAVLSLIHGNGLTVSKLGRHISNANLTKSNINKMNRLIGGTSLHEERFNLYRALNERLLENKKHPVIAIDWSDTHSNSETQMLCATLCATGRGITCYQAVFPQALYNAQKAHEIFIKNLRKVLPKECQPIIVTDAASSFGPIWFKLIEAQGWYWAGRVRDGRKTLYIKDEAVSLDAFSERATSKAEQYCHAAITVSHAHPCRITLIKKKLTARKSKSSTTRRSHRHTTKKHQRDGHLPWVIASSVKLEFNADKIIEIYAARMMIEERFRDVKDPNYGVGLLQSRSGSCRRLENLLLIETLTKFVLWLVGSWLEDKKIARYFQANTVRTHRVLSIVRLAREFIRRKNLRQRWGNPSLKEAWQSFQGKLLCV